MAAQGSLPTSILHDTYSVSDLYRRLDLLQRFLEHSFFGEGTHEGVAALVKEREHLLSSYYQNADEETKRHVGSIAKWSDDVFESFSAENLYDHIQALKQAGDSLPKLTLYVPIHFSPAEVEPIGIWCRANLGASLMLDLRVEPDTVGGCALVYESTYHDLSLTYFAQKERAALTDLVHKYGE